MRIVRFTGLVRKALMLLISCFIVLSTIFLLSSPASALSLEDITKDANSLPEAEDSTDTAEMENTETGGNEDETATEESKSSLGEVQNDVLSFYDDSTTVIVSVEAPADAFLQDTYMTVTAVETKDVLDSINNTLDDPDSVTEIQAVDITFYDKEGKETEPLKEIRVVLSSSLIQKADDTVIVHIDDEGEGTLITQTPESTAEDEIAFEATDFSIYAIVTIETPVEPNEEETDTSDSIEQIIIDEDPKNHTFEFYSPSEDGTFELYTTVILKGEEILTQPNNPEAGVKLFTGWYTDETCTTLFTGFDLPTPELDDGKTEIYAGFTDRLCRITYYYNGNIVTIDTVAQGSTYVFSADYPIFVTTSDEETLYINTGWNTKEDGTGDKYKTGDELVIEEDMILYSMIETRYLVDFISEGGTQTESQFVEATRKLKKPEDPEWTGYKFDGWYSDSEYNNAYDFELAVTRSLELYAKWLPQEVSYTVAVWVENDKYDESKEGEALVAEKYGYLGSNTYTALTGSLIDAEDITGTYKTDADALIRANRQRYMPYVFEKDFTLERNNGVTVKNDGSTVINLYYRYKTLKVQFCSKNGVVLFDGQTIDTRYARGVKVKGTFAEDVLKWTFYNTHYPGGRVIGGQWNILALDDTTVGGFIYINTCQTLGREVDDGAVYQIWDGTRTWSYTFARQYWTETLESSRNNEGSYKDAEYVIYSENRRQNNTTSEGAYAGGISGFTIHHDMTTGAYIQTDGANPLYNYYCYSNQSALRPNPEDATEYYYYADGKKGTTLASFNSHTASSTRVEDGSECIARWYYSRNKYKIDLNRGIGPAVVNPTLSDIPYEENLGRKEYKDPFSFVNNDGVSELYIVDESIWFNDGIAYVFRGFYENSSGLGEPFDFENATMPANNIQLFAIWEPLTLTVNFDANGGTWQGWESEADEPSKTLSYGDNVAKPEDPKPPYEDATFLGWRVVKNSRAAGNDTFFSFSSPITENTNLVAVYGYSKPYELAYDANGGSGDVPPTADYLYNANAVVANGNGLTKDDAKFIGWSDTQEGGKLYYPGDEIVITADKVLYAQYGSDYPLTRLTYDYNCSFKNYGISFPDGNTAYVETMLNNLKITLDNTPGDYYDTENGFYKTTGCRVPRGYRFLGWSNEPNGELISKILVDLEDEDSANIVYALWLRYEKDDNSSYKPPKTGTD